MDRRQLDMVNTLKNSLVIIEALVSRPDVIYYGDEIMMKLQQLREKMHDVQEKFSYCSQVYSVYDKWIQKQKDLLTELENLQERMQYLENNLPAECFQKIAADFCQDNLSPEPSPTMMVNGGLNGHHDFSDSTSSVSQASMMAKTGAQTVVKQESYPSIKHLSNQELEKVPSYIRNRMQLDVVKTFIDNFNAVLKKKYSLVRLPKKKVPKSEIPLYMKWKTQDNKETRGYDFITDEDLSQHGSSKLGKRDYVILQILRHCKRLKETKLNGLLFYLLLKSDF